MKEFDPSKFLDFNLTARASPSGYRNLAVAVIASSSANPFADGDPVVLLVSRVGDRGQTGAQGDSFSPQYVVPNLADRAAYDSGPIFDVNGRRLSVLVQSDASNSNLPTLYFLQSVDPAVWSAGITFSAGSTASQVATTPAGSIAATNVQAAIDELDTVKVPLSSPSNINLSTPNFVVLGNIYAFSAAPLYALQYSNANNFAEMRVLDDASHLKWAWGVNGDSAGGGDANAFYIYQYTDASDADINKFRLKITDAGVWTIDGTLNNVALAGTPTAPTQSVADDSTKIATTAFVQAAVGSAGLPQGRLTLASGTPVMTSDVTGATTVYYTPYVGRRVPIWDAAKFVMTDTGGELSQTLGDATKSPAAAVTGVYDMFVWNDNGVIRCTRGPVWTDLTIRSAGSALVRIQGILVNNAAIPNGPAANRGTYVGTIFVNGTNTVNFQFGGAAAGGSFANFCVWNMYNRVPVCGQSRDTTATWSYATGTWREANNSGNSRIWYVCGLAEDPVFATYQAMVELAGGATNIAYVGIALGAGLVEASLPSGTVGSVGQITGTHLWGTAVAQYAGIPGLGLRFLQAFEYVSPGTAFYYGALASAVANGLTARLRM